MTRSISCASSSGRRKTHLVKRVSISNSTSTPHYPTPNCVTPLLRRLAISNQHKTSPATKNLASCALALILIHTTRHIRPYPLTWVGTVGEAASSSAPGMCSATCSPSPVVITIQNHSYPRWPTRKLLNKWLWLWHVILVSRRLTQSSPNLREELPEGAGHRLILYNRTKQHIL